MIPPPLPPIVFPPPPPHMYIPDPSASSQFINELTQSFIVAQEESMHLKTALNHQGDAYLKLTQKLVRAQEESNRVSKSIRLERKSYDNTLARVRTRASALTQKLVRAQEESNRVSKSIRLERKAHQHALAQIKARVARRNVSMKNLTDHALASKISRRDLIEKSETNLRKITEWMQSETKKYKRLIRKKNDQMLSETIKYKKLIKEKNKSLVTVNKSIIEMKKLVTLSWGPDHEMVKIKEAELAKSTETIAEMRVTCAQLTDTLGKNDLLVNGLRENISKMTADHNLAITDYRHQLNDDRLKMNSMKAAAIVEMEDMMAKRVADKARISVLENESRKRKRDELYVPKEVCARPALKKRKIVPWTIECSLCHATNDSDTTSYRMSSKNDIGGHACQHVLCRVCKKHTVIDKVISHCPVEVCDVGFVSFIPYINGKVSNGW